MTTGRLVRIGNSFGVIIPKRELRALGWWEADIITQRRQDGTLVMENLTQRNITIAHTPTDYGDTISRKS